MNPPNPDRLAAAAFDRLQAELEALAPLMLVRLTPWMRRLAGSDRPQDYFTHPLAFPSLWLPLWLEQALQVDPPPDWRVDIAYSTICGYYFIRLVDNLMDGNAGDEPALLPALQFFHSRFQGIYQHYFPADHPFWEEVFFPVWVGSAQATMQDAALATIDEAQFWQFSAQKVGAARIPLAAVAYRFDAPARLEDWFRFVHRLGGWHQLFNDLLGWQLDLQRGTVTYFLSEAGRRCAPGESIAEWVVREGFAWAVDRLRQWMLDLQAVAAGLGSPGLIDYLARRATMLERQAAETTRGLQELGKIISRSRL